MIHRTSCIALVATLALCLTACASPQTQHEVTAMEVTQITPGEGDFSLRPTARATPLHVETVVLAAQADDSTPVTLEWSRTDAMPKGVALQDALLQTAAAADGDILVAGHVNGWVVGRVTEKPWKSVVRMLAESHGYTVEEREGVTVVR